MTMRLPLALAGILLAAPAFAQTAPAPAPTTAPTTATPTAAKPAAAHMRVEQRVAELHSKLKITAAQEPAFDAFADVMRDNANRMQPLQQQRHETLANGTALDDMKSYQLLAQQHVDDLNRLVPAFEKLYAVLTPDQKLAADQSFHHFQGMGRKRG